MSTKTKLKQLPKRGALEMVEEWSGVCPELRNDAVLLGVLCTVIDLTGGAEKLDEVLRFVAERHPDGE